MNNNRTPIINVIMDLQFGSTGKGLLAGVLANNTEPDTVMTAWAPNAGHTFIDAAGRKYVHTMLANGIVSQALERVMIGPGSLINMSSLFDELVHAHGIGYVRPEKVRILLHEHAAVVTQEDIAEESGPMTAIGSTKKGVGAAMIRRIRRQPGDLNTVRAMADKMPTHPLWGWVEILNTQQWLNVLRDANIIQVEGAQGYSLSMYHGFYPYTTSRDVTTHQVLADVGLPYNFGDVRVFGTCRTFPIRVANRFDDKGNQVGWSGPCYPDQRELTWEELGQPVELTTVTKLPRRVFTFSVQEIAEAIRMTGTRHIFLNFANYLKTANEIDELIGRIESVSGDARVNFIGYGPTEDDVTIRGDLR